MYMGVKVAYDNKEVNHSISLVHDVGGDQLQCWLGRWLELSQVILAPTLFWALQRFAASLKRLVLSSW